MIFARSPFSRRSTSRFICYSLLEAALAFPPAAFAQQLPSRCAVRLADSLFTSGAFRESIVEYERAQWYDPDSLARGPLQRQIARAWEELGRWQEAARHYEESMRFETNDTLLAETGLDLSRCFLRAGETDRGLYHLLRAGMMNVGPVVAKEVAYRRALLSVVKYDWTAARRFFDASPLGPLAPDGAVVSRRLDSLIRACERAHYKSPSKAKWLSTFLPGAGQIYSGHWGAGIYSAVFNGLTTAYLSQRLRHRSGLDIAFSVTVFLRYYKGNRYNAERLTKDRNEELNRRLAAAILSAIPVPSANSPDSISTARWFQREEH